MADLDLTEGEFITLAGHLDDIAADASSADGVEEVLATASAAMPGTSIATSMSTAGSGLDLRVSGLARRLAEFSLEAVVAEQALHERDVAGANAFSLGAHGGWVV
ncbi:hypothetical protein EG850_13005 [Gulosibacter macacae]|uniref:Uncharacterized protein n=1 Tax=Gulosibacter macacae TaxID=2488791 RepID=A0A3P3VY01_9MICO|nr:hypothetical protein [Gulosibacter macacae]RRJ85553.1 hypothetical protein EG850_13005 [Gulosibacter macacae]